MASHRHLSPSGRGLGRGVSRRKFIFHLSLSRKRERERSCIVYWLLTNELVFDDKVQGYVRRNALVAKLQLTEVYGAQAHPTL
jgi:hypothetical protein